MCGLCNRRMQGQWLREMPYYRCRFPDEYANANRLAHPRNVYLREDQLVPPLDEWLLTALAPPHLEESIDAMYSSQPAVTGPATGDPDQEVIKECDRKLANYRSLLDTGTDATLVAGWIAEVTAERVTAQARQRQRLERHGGTRLSKPEIRDLVTAVGDLRMALRRAATKPAKMDVYQRLGIRMTYYPARNAVRVEAEVGPDAVGIGCVSEDRFARFSHTRRSWTLMSR